MIDDEDMIMMGMAKMMMMVAAVVKMTKKCTTVFSHVTAGDGNRSLFMTFRHSQSYVL